MCWSEFEQKGGWNQELQLWNPQGVRTKSSSSILLQELHMMNIVPMPWQNKSKAVTACRRFLFYQNIGNELTISPKYVKRKKENPNVFVKVNICKDFRNYWGSELMCLDFLVKNGTGNVPCPDQLREAWLKQHLQITSFKEETTLQQGDFFSKFSFFLKKKVLFNKCSDERLVGSNVLCSNWSTAGSSRTQRR